MYLKCILYLEYLLGKKLKNLSCLPNTEAWSKVSGKVAPKVSGKSDTAMAPMAQTKNMIKYGNFRSVAPR